MFYEKPMFFEQNRVFRPYLGGKLMGKFVGKDFEDDHFPEEWVASAVKAINKGITDPYDGISKLVDSDLYFNEALQKYPKEILGDKTEFSVLVKYLDSAIRLPVQAHPDRKFSKEHFNSTHGKEESWYILDTRENATVCFGFEEGVTEEQFRQAIANSETDKDSMNGLLKCYKVKKGDVIYIPAKAVHAIGAGCLILEVQEPTDFTIQPERWCGDYRLSEQEMYIGLSMDEAMECFTFEPSPSPFVQPRLLSDDDNATTEELIGSKETESFRLTRTRIKKGDYTLSENAIYIVGDGEGVIRGEGYERAVKKGEYFFMPYLALDKFTISGDNLELLVCT
ncbi:MAG: mannose-6-phosphate isomerase [Ruminococcaceae bacterium]|nr:mannose-6-phosphate isomerase [Oscillospiraceae bacterium]